MFRKITPEAALQRLIEGNQSYASDKAAEDAHAHAVQRRQLIHEQHPFAVVLGCSDSRVPIEIVFNQSLGDLFVIRVAGNILNDHVIGSIEYAVQNFGSPLVMVLGHSNCGAVTAAVDEVMNYRHATARIATIVDAIRPNVERVRKQPDVIEAAIAENVRSVTDALQQVRPIIAAARAKSQLAVVGAEYHLSTGLVSVVCGDLAERSPQKR